MVLMAFNRLRMKETYWWLIGIGSLDSKKVEISGVMISLEIYLSNLSTSNIL